MAYIQIPAFTKINTLDNDTEFVIVVDGVEYLVTFKTLSDKFGNTPELLAEIEAEITALRSIVDAFPSENPAAPIALKISDTPTIDGLYKPTETGVYPNAGGLEYDPTEGITYFIRTNGVWTKDVTPINFTPTGVVEEGNTQAVSGGEVFEKVTMPNQVGIQKFPAGYNYISELVGSLVSNTDMWEPGAIRSTDGSINDTSSALAGYYRTKKYYIVPSGQEVIAQFRQNLQPNMGYAFYNENFNFISGGVSGISEFNLSIPTEALYIKFSHRFDHLTSFLKIIGSDDFEVTTEDVFLKSSTNRFDLLKNEITEEYEQKIESEFESFGFETIYAETNFLAELNTTTLEENEFWGAGYLNASGVPDPQGRRWHSKKYYEIIGGEEYEFRFYMTPTIDCIFFYDSNYEIVQTIQSPTYPATYIGEVTVVPSAKYIRISQIDGQQYVPNIYFRNKNEIKISPENDEISKFDKNIYIKQHPPKNKRPIVSFISDDGHQNNDWYINILNDKNIKSTFAIVKDWVGTPSFYGEAKILELYHNGHDIAGHSTTHPRLADITISEAINEIYECKEYLLTLVEKNNVFVPPFGSRNIEVDKVIRELYDCSVRTNYRLESPTLDGVSNQPPIDKYLLNRFSFDVQINNTPILNKAKEAVDEALLNNGWLIFAIHPHYTEYRTDLTGGTMRRQELSDLIDYIQSLNIPILTVTKALQIWDNPVSIGNRRLDSEYWELGMNGSETGTLL